MIIKKSDSIMSFKEIKCFNLFQQIFCIGFQQNVKVNIVDFTSSKQFWNKVTSLSQFQITANSSNFTHQLISQSHFLIQFASLSHVSGLFPFRLWIIIY